MPLASSISGIPHLAAFDGMAAARYDGLDLSVLLLYLVDQAPESALYFLADQFDVLGWRGWLLADTAEKRRDLIKKAIQLHRKKGTPWSIKEALKSIGFDNVEIIEGVGVNYDGAFNYDGSQDYNGGFWANFIVRIFVADSGVITPEQINSATNLINEYKNERSNLVDLEFLDL